MNIEHYKKIMTDENKKLSRFVSFLRAEYKLPLSHIDTNDWACNLKPSVYVHGKDNMFEMARYSRCSAHDLKLAVNFYENN